MIVCPSVDNVIVTTGTLNGAFVSFSPPTASDNSGGFVDVQLFPIDQQGPNTVFGFASHAILYRATDPSGNIANCAVTTQLYIMALDKRPVKNDSCCIASMSIRLVKQ